MTATNSFQFYHNASGSKIIDNPINALLASWLRFADKTPKGFGKFFGKDGDSGTEAPKEKPADGAPSGEKKAAEPSPKQQQQPKLPHKFTFKSGGGGGGGSGGSPFGGGSDKQKMYLFGGLAIGAALGFHLYQTAAYEEIGWQEFVKT